MNFNKQLKDGLIYQNPVLVQVLGMCSTMAITTSVANGFGMGISVLIILTLSNIFISLAQDHPQRSAYRVLHRRHRGLRYDR